MTGHMKKIVFFVFLAGFGYSAYQFMIKPGLVDLAEKRIRVEKNLTRLAEFEQAKVTAEDLSRKLDRLEKAIETLESKLPPKSQVHKVLEQVTVIAQKQGMKPKTIRTLNKKDCNGYIEQPLRMELVGNFKSFYSFLLELETLPRIMKIRQLQLNKQKGDEGQIGINFVVSIFFQDKAV